MLNKDHSCKSRQQLKTALTHAPTLFFYDVEKPVTIQCNAFQFGSLVFILQYGKPMEYALRAMTKAEYNYAQIDREMLSIVFAARNFYQHIYGKELAVIGNDHKQLETIVKKTMNKFPPRLQRMMLNLQPYDLHVNCVSGKFMYLADTIFRPYLSIQNADYENQETDVYSKIKNIPIATSKLQEYLEAIALDSTVQTVAKYCQDKCPRVQ